MLGPVAVLALLLAIAGLARAIARVRVTPADLIWIAGGHIPEPDEADVYVRYLTRHRAHRLAGGLFGITLAIVVGIRMYSSVSIGIGQGSPLGDVLFCGLVGVLLGALSAESFRLSEPRQSQAAASLAPRAPGPHPRLVVWARMLTAGALLLGVGVAVAGGDWTPLAVALGGLLVVAVAEATRAAIAGRRRPVLSDRARLVDAAMRGFAARSVVHLELAAAVLVVGWTLAKMPISPGSPLAAATVVTTLVALVAVVMLLRRAAPRPRGRAPAAA